ncbi:MAG TPA: hypothetical protein DDW82_00365 [Acholeplasmataceae bacterium]|nr:hypothetical protein [Acholeplasmataceae bacterium]HCB66409.1 hypothetical protein [Acholeplasmataceae bacterium]
MIQMKQTFHYKIEVNENSISFEFYLTKPNHTADAHDGSLTEQSEKRRFGIKLSYDWSQVEEADEIIEMINNGELIEMYQMSRNMIESCHAHS